MDTTFAPNGSIEKALKGDYNFKIGNVLKESWHKVSGFKATAFCSVFVITLISLLLVLPLTISEAYMAKAHLLGFAGQMLVQLIIYPMVIGLLLVSIYNVIGIKKKCRDIFKQYSNFAKIFWGFVVSYFSLFLALIIFTVISITWVFIIEHSGHHEIILSITSGIIIEIAAILGIAYLMCVAYFSVPLAVEKHIGYFKAYGITFRAIRFHWFKIILTWIIMMIILFLSLFLLIIGLIWTIPMKLNLFGTLYRIMFGVEA